MIPRKIHYCWFGKNPKPALVQQCILSWGKHFKDFEIIEWNEDNFDIAAHPFAAYMHRAKKWAFLSDYVRMYVINKFGGVYLDSDCEAHDNLEPFLHHRAFTGFERFFYTISPFTAIFGAEARHPWVAACLEYYDTADLTKNSEILFKTNTVIVTDIIQQRYQVRLKDKLQELGEGMVIYPSYTLCTPNYWHKKYITHHFNGSWISGAKATQNPLVRAVEFIFRVSPVWTHVMYQKIIVALKNIFKK
jgi:hypothetical protein